MTITARIYGHDVYYNSQEECWRYQDNHQIVKGVRGCPQCGEPPTPEGHDACLGTIPGAIYACCGHGRQDGYVLWEQPTEGRVDHEYRIGKFGFTLTRFISLDEVSPLAQDIKPIEFKTE